MKYVIALSGYQAQDYMYPWQRGEQLLYLGELENNKGHGVYMQTFTGKVHHGYHIDNFFEYTDEHYDQHCLSDFLKSTHGVWCLPQNLLDLLIELDKSHTPEAAEKSFVQQASKIVFPNIKDI